MRKYYIHVAVSVYAESPEDAKREVIHCLNTGDGHVHDFRFGTIKTNRAMEAYPLPCGCEIYQTCSKCKGT